MREAMLGEYRRQVKLLQQSQAKERAEATRQKALELQQRQDDFEEKLSHAHSQLEVLLLPMLLAAYVLGAYADAAVRCCC